MSDDLIVFRELVLWLWRTHERPWDYSNQTAKLMAEEYNFAVSSITETELEFFLPSKDKVETDFPNNRYFYLSPVTKGRVMVPRIRLKCDFGQNIPEIRCRLELFLFDENIEIQSLGYRFESPEGKNDEEAGIHHYYHIQMIQPPTSRVDWLPEKQPAFPIDADDPVKLILSLLISLYGLNYLDTQLRNADVWNLDNYIHSISCVQFGMIEWYRLIEIGDPVRHTEGYKITSNPKDFETQIRKIYPGCVIKGITPSVYNTLKEKKNFP